MKNCKECSKEYTDRGHSNFCTNLCQIRHKRKTGVHCVRHGLMTGRDIELYKGPTSVLARCMPCKREIYKANSVKREYKNKHLSDFSYDEVHKIRDGFQHGGMDFVKDGMW